MKLELVIFDMDGLMIDTEPTSKEGWRLGLEKYGFAFSAELFETLIGRNLHGLKEKMEEYYGSNFDFHKVRKVRADYMVKHITDGKLEMKKGLLDILDKLDELKLKKCVATSTDWDSMNFKLGTLNLLKRFDGFMTGDRVEKGKPNPEIFLKAAALLNVPYSSCIVLEDSINGIAAAHAAGMKSIVVPDTQQPDAETLKNVYANCADLVEAADVITRLLAESRHLSGSRQ